MLNISFHQDRNFQIKKSRKLETTNSYRVLSNGSTLNSQPKRFFLESKWTCMLNIPFHHDRNFQIKEIFLGVQEDVEVEYLISATDELPHKRDSPWSRSGHGC
jgi:hypothetical protein